MRTRAPRAFVLWSAAIAVAAGTAVLVSSDLATLHRRASTFGPERDAVVATHPLVLGVVLDRGDVRTRRVHRSQLPHGVLADAALAVGRVVTVPVVRDGFVADGNLAPRSRTGFDGALPVGTRAIRITVDDAIRPPTGSAVDVLATLDIGIGSSESLDAATSTAVASGVQVLRVDGATGADGRSALGITVLVSPRQSRDLAYAAAHGALTIALVPPEEARAP